MAHCIKLSYTTLSRMAQNALWAQKKYIDLGMLDQARRYESIWNRLAAAMLNNIKEGGRL